MTRLSDRTLRLIGYGFAAVVSAGAVTSIALSLRMGETGRAVELAVLVAVFAPVLFVLVRVQPRNRAIWALLVSSGLGASQEAISTVFEYRWGTDLQTVLVEGLGTVAPADLDPMTAIALYLGSSMYLGFFILTIHFLVLFPDGRSPSMPWRVVLWLSAAMMIAPAGFSARYLAPWVDRPYDPATIDVDAVNIIGGTVTTALLVISAAALLRAIRVYRRSSAVERLQFRWLIWAVALNVIPWSGVGDAVSPVLASVGSTVALAAVPVAVAIAITKHRLYDIDLVISRSLLFIGLVGFITIVYAAVVTGIGSVVGGASLGWSIAATAIVAIVFEPVRHRLQRWINRLVYGQRATPYEVLADLTGRLARTEREEGILDRMAQRVAEGTGADRVMVWTAADGGYEVVACEPPEERHLAAAMSPDELGGVVVPIVHDGETLGAITVESRRGESLSVTERRLVDDLCGSAGLIMRRRRLDDQLEEKAEQLEESRRRLVSAQDDERRRLEQQLNHGPKQQVVTLRADLAAAEQYARSNGVDQIADFLAQMVTETQDAIDQIDALALGIYPPLLEAQGLATAVRTLAESAPVDVRLDVADTARHRQPLPLEAAAYFCISEALTNAIKHGTPPITIQLSSHDNQLTFTVTDTGPGFDPATVTRGSGLNNLNDRLDALNGTITINSAPGRATVVIGELPLDLATSVP